MLDVDSKILSITPSYFSKLAWDLDVAMALDDAAQARYAAIYGVAWTPLHNDACSSEATEPSLDSEIESAFARAVRAEACTVA